MPARDAAPTPASGHAALRVLRSAGVSEAQLRGALAAHGEALASGRGVLKDGARTAVTRVDCGGACACVKEYRSAGLVDWVKGLLRGPRGCRAWRGGQHLARKGVSSPELLALARERGSTFLLTRYVEGATPLDQLFATRFAGPLPPAELAAKRVLVRQLGRWLRQVHSLGVYHDDWSAKNFLAAQRGDAWVFYVLDFESLSARKRLTWRRRAKNLAQLADVPAGATRTDLLRFLTAYALGERALTRGRFPRDILRALARRVAARERRMRKLCPENR
ncbi:MAG: hypothetical protein FJ290_25480 [Planctomycetes bacterium]|nr:hypothetical protein [Planctomycetota bacterium]